MVAVRLVRVVLRTSGGSPSKAGQNCGDNMTKKHYQKAAKLIKKRAPKPKQRSTMVETFVEFFKNDNPLFDEERFRFACQREVK